MCVCALLESRHRTSLAALCDTTVSSFFRLAHLFPIHPLLPSSLPPLHPSLHHSVWLKDLLSILKVWSLRQLKTNPIASELLCVYVWGSSVCMCVVMYVYTYMYENVCTCVCVWDVRFERLMQLGLFHSPLRSLCWPPDPKANNTESIIMTIGLCAHMCVWVCDCGLDSTQLCHMENLS